MNKRKLQNKIREWLRDYELATNTFYGDDNTLDGAAYNLLNEVGAYLRKEKNVSQKRN